MSNDGRGGFRIWPAIASSTNEAQRKRRTSGVASTEHRWTLLEMHLGIGIGMGVGEKVGVASRLAVSIRDVLEASAS